MTSAVVPKTRARYGKEDGEEVVGPLASDPETRVRCLHCPSNVQLLDSNACPEKMMSSKIIDGIKKSVKPEPQSKLCLGRTKGPLKRPKPHLESERPCAGGSSASNKRRLRDESKMIDYSSKFEENQITSPHWQRRKHSEVLNLESGVQDELEEDEGFVAWEKTHLAIYSEDQTVACGKCQTRISFQACIRDHYQLSQNPECSKESLRCHEHESRKSIDEEDQRQGLNQISGGQNQAQVPPALATAYEGGEEEKPSKYQQQNKTKANQNASPQLKAKIIDVFQDESPVPADDSSFENLNFSLSKQPMLYTGEPDGLELPPLDHRPPPSPEPWDHLSKFRDNLDFMIRPSHEEKAVQVPDDADGVALELAIEQPLEQDQDKSKMRAALDSKAGSSSMRYVYLIYQKVIIMMVAMIVFILIMIIMKIKNPSFGREEAPHNSPLHSCDSDLTTAVEPVSSPSCECPSSIASSEMISSLDIIKANEVSPDFLLLLLREPMLRGSKSKHENGMKARADTGSGLYIITELRRQNLLVKTPGNPSWGTLRGQVGMYAAGWDPIYEGEIVDGKANGFGRWVDSDNCMYEGQHKDNREHGFGRFIQGNSVRIGIWEKGRRVKTINYSP